MRTFWQLVCLCLPLSGEAAVKNGLEKRAVTQFNTPVRVLLDRGSRQPAVLESPQRTLFVKIRHPGPWTAVGKRAELRASDRGTLRLGKLEGRTLYVRGGERASDRFRYGGRTYRGLLKLIAQEGGWLAVNVLPLEEYLAGTLPSEMSPSWELEALKAQAVASRSYALHMVRHPRHEHYDLVSTTDDQVYGGADREADRVARALTATAGEFLGTDGEPVKVFFHSRCGGATDPETVVWGRSRELHAGVICPYCGENPYRWSFSVPYADLMEAVQVPRALKPAELMSLERSPSGRVTEWRLPRKRLNADTLRARLGYQNLKSTRFQWRLEKDHVHFTGTGSGHGVGMCQWGAQHLARQGKSYREILAHYYPRLKLSRPTATP